MVKLSEVEKKQADAAIASKEKAEAKAEKAPKAGAKKEVKEESALAKTATLHDLEVILYPLVTEKSVNMIEAENKVSFIVSDTATKPEIKKVIQGAYGVKVDKVNVIRDMRGRKKAIVKLDKKDKASELATKLRIL